MKHSVKQVLLALAAVCTFGSGLYAQSYAIQVKVPFAFEAANRVMPAGDYTLAKPDTLNAQTIRSDERGQILALAAGERYLSGNGHARVVFHKYGNKAFLAEVWAGDGKGLKLPASREEKAAREMVASNQPETITIVASLW